MTDLNDSYLKMAQGPAVLANSVDIDHDVAGITYPNLHRRIDNEDTPIEDDEVAPDTYDITVKGVNSYRTTNHTVHDEASTTSEIP